MRRNKSLINMIKHVSEYSNERKYKANIELGQFMYNANKHNKKLLRVKNNKKIKYNCYYSMEVIYYHCYCKNYNFNYFIYYVH